MIDLLSVAQSGHVEFESAITCVALEEAVDLYRGDLLPGCYDDWIVPERGLPMIYRAACQAGKRGTFREGKSLFCDLRKNQGHIYLDHR